MSTTRLHPRFPHVPSRARIRQEHPEWTEHEISEEIDRIEGALEDERDARMEDRWSSNPGYNEERGA